MYSTKSTSINNSHDLPYGTYNHSTNNDRNNYLRFYQYLQSIYDLVDYNSL